MFYRKGCHVIDLFSLQSSDFYFDNPKEANERGFNFEPLKVSALI